MHVRMPVRSMSYCGGCESRSITDQWQVDKAIEICVCFQRHDGKQFDVCTVSKDPSVSLLTHI